MRRSRRRRGCVHGSARGRARPGDPDAGPETIGAMIAEPVSVSSGMFPPPASYFPKIAADLTQIRHPLFVDEVVTGFGRSGRMWASEAMGLKADCVTCAKGISGAYMPTPGLSWARNSPTLDLGNRCQRLVRPWRHAPCPCGVRRGGCGSAQCFRTPRHSRACPAHDPPMEPELDGFLDHPLVAGTANSG